MSKIDIADDGPTTIRKQWKTIALFAIVGLAVAAVVCANWEFQDYTKPASATEVVLGLASAVFCPATLLFAACIDCEPVGWGGVLMFSIIGVLNATLYGGIGWAVAGIRQDRNRSAAP